MACFSLWFIVYFLKTDQNSFFVFSAENSFDGVGHFCFWPKVRFRLFFVLAETAKNKSKNLQLPLIRVATVDQFRAVGHWTHNHNCRLCRWWTSCTASGM